jgi:hypothetical protein
MWQQQIRRKSLGSFTLQLLTLTTLFQFDSSDSWLALRILLMPMSIVASGISTFEISAATAALTHVFLGIDEVGMEIENVIQLLPLQQLAETIRSGRRRYAPSRDAVVIRSCCGTNHVGS